MIRSIHQPKKSTIDETVTSYNAPPKYIKKAYNRSLDPNFCPLDQRKENAVRIRRLIKKDMEKERDWYKWSINIAYLFMGDYDKAEDVVCELISNMMDGRARTYEYIVDDSKNPFEDSRLRGWWYISIKNQCTDCRRVKRYRGFGISENTKNGTNISELYPQELFESPVEQATKKETIEKVMAVIQKFDKDYRALISMHYLEGLPYTKMAEIMNIPMGTAQSKLHTAIKKLRALEEIAGLGLN